MKYLTLLVIILSIFSSCQSNFSKRRYTRPYFIGKMEKVAKEMNPEVNRCKQEHILRLTESKPEGDTIHVSLEYPENKTALLEKNSLLPAENKSTLLQTRNTEATTLKINKDTVSTGISTNPAPERLRPEGSGLIGLGLILIGIGFIFTKTPLMLSILLLLPGVFFSLISVIRINNHPEKYSGKKLAVTLVILGILGIIVTGFTKF